MNSLLIQEIASQRPELLANLQSYYSEKDIVVTGGLGFIGSNLAIALVDLGARLTLVDSLIPEYGGTLFNIDPIRNRVTVNVSDVRDRSSMNFLVRGRMLLFNLAGTLSHTDSMRDPFTDLAINCTSQLSILEACRYHNPEVKVVFAGTRGQYGKTGNAPVDEQHVMRPADVNGINNVAGEGYHLLYNDVYGIRACSLRLTNTFGPRHQMRHHRQGVLNWFIRQILEGKPIRLYGDGGQIRDTNYVADVVEALLLAGMSEKVNGEAYNLGGDAVSLLQFVELAIQVAGLGSFELVPYPPESKQVEVGDYVANYQKFSMACGWQPRIGLREGLTRTLQYYREFGAHYWNQTEHPLAEPELLPKGA